jgi:cardiolipin synthase
VATPGQRVIKLVAGDPDRGVNPTYTALLRAIDASQRSVQLTMAYFAPGSELIQALCDAARRGVAVSLVLPGRSDVALVLHAARARYTQLLEAGVQIHEMNQAVMHAKTAVIDGVFSTVGSSNLDWRSIVGNNEMDVIILGEDFGEQMQALFARDVAASTRIEAATWSRRGLGRRLMESFARLIEPLL